LRHRRMHSGRPFVFHASPEPLHEYVVDPSALAIYAGPDLMLFENAGEIVASKLAALVGVENLWSTVGLDSVFKRINTKGHVQRVRKAPGQHATRVPVDHSQGNTPIFRGGAFNRSRQHH